MLRSALPSRRSSLHAAECRAGGGCGADSIAPSVEIGARKIMPDQSQPTDDRNPEKGRSGLSTTLAFLSAALVVAFLYFARDVIVPMTLAVLLSFLLSPAVRALCRWRIGRVTAVGVTVLVAFFIIFGFAAVVVHEISSLARDLPENRYNLQTKVRSLPELVPGGAVFHRITGMLRDLRKELTTATPTAAP